MKAQILLTEAQIPQTEVRIIRMEVQTMEAMMMEVRMTEVMMMEVQMTEDYSDDGRLRRWNGIKNICNPAVWIIQSNYEHTKEQRREQRYFFALYVFYKKHIKYIKKLLQYTHIFN